MALVLMKRGKYLEGHSYATGSGYTFSWTTLFEKARRFADWQEGNAQGFANQTGATIKGVPNTKAELKAKARNRMQYGT